MSDWEPEDWLIVLGGVAFCLICSAVAFAIVVGVWRGTL